MFENLTLDTTLNVEGVATAIGVLGAAMGYLISLTANWRRSRREDKFRGTKLVIMNLLEQVLPNGMSEEGIIEAYKSPQTTKLRSSWGAWHPDKLDELAFERELTSLRADRLIDLIDINTYRLRHDPIFDYDKRELSKSQIRDFVSGNISKQEIRTAAMNLYESDAPDYERREAAETLLLLRDEDALAKIKSDLTSSTPDRTKIALAVLSQNLN